MKKIKALLISAACLALSFTAQGYTCPEIPRSINTQALSEFDAAALYSQIKNAKKAFEVAMTDPYQFPFSTAQMRKMTAFVVGYYVFRTVICEKINQSVSPYFFNTCKPGLCGKDGYNLFIKSMDLFAGKLAWDRLGDEVKALNRFIDAWAGYFYDQTIENAQKAYDSVSSMLQPAA